MLTMPYRLWSSIFYYAYTIDADMASQYHRTCYNKAQTVYTIATSVVPCQYQILMWEKQSWMLLIINSSQLAWSAKIGAVSYLQR